MIFDSELRLVDGQPCKVLDIEVVAQKFVARCESELEAIYQKASEASLNKQGEELLSDECAGLTTEQLVEAAQAIFSVMIRRTVAKEIDNRAQKVLANASC